MSAMILHPLVFTAGMATAGLIMLCRRYGWRVLLMPLWLLLGKLGLINVQ